MNYQPVIAFPNRIDEATLSGGSWLSALPLTNLQDIRYAKKARTANLLVPSGVINIDLGRQRDIRLVALISHNLTELATIRIRGSAADPTFAVTSFDSGSMSAYPSVSSLSLAWEDPGFWFGTIDSERRAYYPSHAIYLMDSPAFARYIRVEITDTSNPDGFIELGRIFVGPSWSPVTGIAAGFQIGHEDVTTVEESVGRTEYFDRRPLVRTMRFSLDFLQTSEIFGPVFDFERQLGISGEAFIVPLPDQPDKITQTAFPCRIRQLSPAELPSYGVWQKNFELKERVG